MRHLLNIIHPDEPFPGPRPCHGFGGSGFLGRNEAFQRAANAKACGQRPRVNSLDARNAVFIQIFGQRRIRSPVADHGREFTNHKTRHVRPPRFHVLVVHSVIADQRISHGYNLPFVGRVGEDFLVAGHRGVETNLPARRDARAKTFAVIYRAVFEGQNRFHRCLHKLRAMLGLRPARSSLNHGNEKARSGRPPRKRKAIRWLRTSF